MVLFLPLVVNFPSHFFRSLVNVPMTLIIIGITVTFMFHSFFRSLVRLKYLSIFEVQTITKEIQRIKSRPEVVLINKKEKILSSSGFYRSSLSRSEKKARRQIPGSCQRTEKDVEHECDCDSNCRGCLERRSQIGDQKKNLHHITVKFCLNTKKSPGNLKRLTVTQTSVKHYQSKLVWKTR